MTNVNLFEPSAADGPDGKQDKLQTLGIMRGVALKLMANVIVK